MPKPKRHENYMHHEGAGFHLSVNRYGVVSLWDTKELAQNVQDETYLWLDLTETQLARVEAAERRAQE